MPLQNTLGANKNRVETFETIADRLRWHVLKSTSKAGSGHPTSCFSCAELIAVLLFGFLRFAIKDPRLPTNDRFVLSKGHAAPILWAAWAEAEAFASQKLETLRTLGSELEGHPTPRSPYVATGSLGLGLSNAVGMAAGAKLDGLSNVFYVLLGDGEVSEGSVWEAAALASHRGLDNLVAILDVNRLGQTGPTMLGHDLTAHAERFEAFGWHTQTVDGHNVRAIARALQVALAVQHRPSILIAKTVKGKGVSFLEDSPDRHGEVLEKEELERAARELGGLPELPHPIFVAEPPGADPMPARMQAEHATEFETTPYDADKPVATREAYGNALCRLGAVNPSVVVLDGDVGNSTHAGRFAEKYPHRFIESYIAEQNMVGMAVGLSSQRWIPFVSSFACFLSRAHDAIRMAAISGANVKFCGSHAGVSIGEDGPSQMGLEDLGMMRALPGSTVLYPADAVATERLVAAATAQPGITYIRTSRPKSAILYDASDSFEVGGSHLLESSPEDEATLVAAGVTVHEALKAHQQLLASGIHTRVIDLYSIKPLDQSALERAAHDTDLVITVEDHYREGGLGEAVASVLAGSCPVVQLAVDSLPQSGSTEELLHASGIDAGAIIKAVKTHSHSRRKHTTSSRQA